MTEPTSSTADREELLSGYVLGDLSPEETARFEQALAADPGWADEVREIAQGFDLIGHAVATEPPSVLRRRVLDAVSRAGAPTPRRAHWPRRAAWAALAASLVLAVGVHELRLRRELSLLREATATLQAPNVVLSFDLRDTGGPGGAYGQAILDLDAKKAALVIRGLPELPPGEEYWLWAMVGDEHVPCGRFDSDASEGVVRQLAIPVREYTEPVSRLLVTVESGAGGERPRGPTVMVSS